jgi:hypothetical protein
LGAPEGGFDMRADVGAADAVKMPASGFTPEAMAKAMASGSATIPTVIPATRSAVNSLRE